MSRTLISAAGILLPLIALGDARFHMVDQANKVEGTYAIKDGKVRLETAEESGHSMIYDAATHMMTVLDHDERRYMRMNTETAAAAGAAVSDAMSELEKQLEMLPPEQREAMKQFLPEAATKGPAALPVVAARRTGKSDTVAGAPCDLVEITMDGTAMGEACVATKAASFLSDADQQTLHAMFQDMSKLASSVIGGETSRSGQALAALDGVPLRWRDAESGHATETRFDANASVEAAAFEIPAGYTEQKIEIPR